MESRLGPRLLLILLALPATARPFEPRTHEAVRVDSPPLVDGDLSDPAWRLAQPTGGMIQRYPDPGKPASFPTEIRVLYDDEALYIGAMCHDPQPEGIVALTTRRDQWIESDWFGIGIDSRRDRRTGFFFAVNAAGVLLDGTYFEENQISEDWDGVWEAASRVVDAGWQTEMRIPLKLLRFQPGDDVRFGLNYYRHISRTKEELFWQHIPPDSGLNVSRFGELTGLVLEQQPVELAFIPYIALRLDLAGDTSDSQNRALDVGSDALIGLGSGFNLTLAANPDFGQVEMDQVVLNLSTIETYYPEKRTFFLEDRSLFRTLSSPLHRMQTELFYTRRIGRTPRTPELADDEELDRAPRLPRIYAAAKLAGQTDGRLSVGLLQAVTSREEARVETSDGKLVSRLAEPLTSFSVLSLRQDFWSHSSVGLMATSTASADEGAALTGGAELQMKLFDQDYRLRASTFFSYLTADRHRWQDDFVQAALEREGPLGYGGMLTVAKTGGEHLVGHITGFYYSANLALNDVGYLDRADRAFLTAQLTHRRLKPLGPINRYEVGLGGWIERSARNVDLGDGIGVDFFVDFTNGWSTGARIFSGWPKCDDRETRTAGEVLFCGQAHRWRTALWLESDRRRLVHANLEFKWSTTERGAGFKVYLTSELNVHPRLQLGLIPGYKRHTGDIRWIDTEELDGVERHLFAEQHTEFWDLTLRGTLTFATTLTLQVYAQLFLAAVDHRTKYGPPRGGERVIRVEDLVELAHVADEHDYSSASINLSALLRWEYLPGSVAYLVYSNALSEELEVPEFRFGNTLTDLPDWSGQHALMLKVSYHW